MRLLSTNTLQLSEFSGDLPGSTHRPGSRRIPNYAILSHCWRDSGEVQFHDIQNLECARRMTGFPKIEQSCSQALKIGYNWAWVDTCCIDKSSSAELSEAINSMFNWYAHADTCFVYLEDVEDESPYPHGSSFRKSRWFTRGWTLQELVAPKFLIFFSKSWTFLGTKASLITLLSDITKIPAAALSHTSPFSSFSIAQRMSWAAKRQTTRIEDRAYSLMGIFDIYMPIIYGEGTSSFTRLQLQIIQRSSDQSIFAWTLKGSAHHILHLSDRLPIDTCDSGPRTLELPPDFPLPSSISPILAPSPLDFQDSGNIVPLPLSTTKIAPDKQSGAMAEYSWTHLGLRIHMPLIPVQIGEAKVQQFIALLSCWDPEERSVYGILLQGDDERDPYRCYNIWVSDGKGSYSVRHLISMSKGDYDEVASKLVISKVIYISNEPDPRNESEPGLDSIPSRNSASLNSSLPSRLQLLIVIPSTTLKGLKEMGFYPVGHASRHGEESTHDVEVRRESEGDLFFELQVLFGTCGPFPSKCPSACAHVLFHNDSTHQAFSVFIGYSRNGLLDRSHPKVSVDVAFHRPAPQSTPLDAQILCDTYNHHDFHSHFRIPAYIKLSSDGTNDSWIQFKRDDTDNSPGLIRHCECKCNGERDAANTMIFGDANHGLLVTTNVWRHRNADDGITRCSAWVELLLL